MSRKIDIEDLKLIAAGNALSAAVENDLEDQGLIIQTDQPYATITPKGQRLLAEEA